MRTVVAVLAAGLSRRLGQPKQLLDFRGQPLIRHAASVALGAGAETIVVTNHGDALHGLPITILPNPNAAEGISSSIRVAVLHARDARILFTLCDQPLVTSEHLRKLIATDAPIVATAYSGTCGVPALFSPQFHDELLALGGDRGARAVIEAHIPEVVVVDAKSASVDIDTMADVREIEGIVAPSSKSRRRK
ncbi:MAG TPA: nucleotidyltransferase family protein [Thermoanaerobaculia bacterium]|nr:nucleotidyltransferase family protein [Thermoanaerobaculia bacterium]